MSYFLTYDYSNCKIEVKLDLSNYETKSDWKNATGVDTSKFAKKDDLAKSKVEADKVDTDKLEKVSSGSSSLKSKKDLVKQFK